MSDVDLSVLHMGRYTIRLHPREVDSVESLEEWTLTVLRAIVRSPISNHYIGTDEKYLG